MLNDVGTWKGLLNFFRGLCHTASSVYNFGIEQAEMDIDAERAHIDEYVKVWNRS